MIPSDSCDHPAETTHGTCIACGAVLPPQGTTWQELDGPEADEVAEEARTARSRRLARALIGWGTEDGQLVSTRALVEAQGGRCGICGGELDWNMRPGPERAAQTGHLDHILPLELGGRHLLANFQMTHRACNLSKGARFLTTCPWPPERELSPARKNEKRMEALTKAWWDEYWNIAAYLALTPRHVMHVEIANTWERLSIAQKVRRWRDWLAYLGPAPVECARGMEPLGIGGMHCGEISDVETVERKLWTIANMNRGGSPAPPYLGWTATRLAADSRLRRQPIDKLLG